MNQIAKLFSGSSLTRSALEISEAAVVVANGSGKILFANQNVQQWFGYARSEITGQALDGLLPEIRNQDRDSDAHRAPRVSQPTTAMIDHVPQRVLCKDGTEMLVNLTLFSVQEESQQLLLANLVKPDQEKMDHPSLESERLDAVAEMISGLAHKSRNALQRAVACLDLLELDLEANAKQMELSTKIRRSLSDLLENYDEVKRFAQPISLNPEPTHLLPLCREAFEDVVSKSGLSGPLLSIVERDDVNDLASVDREKMKEVFRHVLDNAVDGPNARVRIRIDCTSLEMPAQSAVRVSVLDDGVGFSDEALVRAFEPFYTTKQHGTGLGLSICRRMIEAHGGVIRAANPVTGGAQVEIDLPRQTSS